MNVVTGMTLLTLGTSLIVAGCTSTPPKAALYLVCTSYDQMACTIYTYDDGKWVAPAPQLHQSNGGGKSIILTVDGPAKDQPEADACPSWVFLNGKWVKVPC